MKLYDDFIMPAVGTVFEICLYLDTLIFYHRQFQEPRDLRTVGESTVETIKALNKLHCSCYRIQAKLILEDVKLVDISGTKKGILER